MTDVTAANVGSEASTRRKHWPIIILVVAAIGVGLTGVPIMFGTFMTYDDEGYVLLSLRNFAEHGHLYRDVFSQYGPLPYAFYYGLHLLGLPLVHTTGRLITLALWSGTALLCATGVWRLTRSLGWALLTLAATFVYLWPSVREPNHPGSLVAIIVAGMALGGAHFLAAGKRDIWAALAGASVAALALTKINTGCYAAAALAAFAALHCENATIRRWAPWLLAAAFVALPFALMHPRLGTPWINLYAALFSLSSLAIFAGTSEARRNDAPLQFSWRQLGLAIAGAAVMAIVVLGVVMPRGTSFGELIDGIVTRPLRQRTFFRLEPPPAFALLASALISCLAVAGALRFRAVARRKIDEAVVAARFVAAAAVLGMLTLLDKTEWHAALFWWMAPWLWIFVWPVAGEEGMPAIARIWLALVALGQWLHAYPVPGTQLAWSTFLTIPLSFWAARDAARWIAPRWLPSRAVLLVCRAFILAIALLLAPIASIWRQACPLNLPGSAGIRLPDETAATYRVLSINAAAHAHTLFSQPGMFSFNLWTGLRTPTLSNVTHWFHLLTATEQQRMIAALEADPRACIILDTYHTNILRCEGMAPAGPLYDYLEQNFAPSFKLDQFEFRVRNGRRIAPFFTAELLQRANADSSSDSANALLRMPLLPFSGRKVARIELASADNLARPLLVLDGANSRIDAIPITMQGDATGAAVETRLPTDVTAPTLLAVRFDAKKHTFSLQRTIIVLRDENGAELGLARLRP